MGIGRVRAAGWSAWVAAAGLVAMAGWAAEAQTPPAASKAMLPQDHDYQKGLRTFMATLKEEDFQPAHKELTVVPFEGDADGRFRMWIMSLMPPAVGAKRNYSSVMLKSAHFTLETIEGTTSVMRPPAHPEPLGDLAGWDYPGNPYFGSRALKLRAFAVASLDMIMSDRLADSADEKERPNQDQLAGLICRLAYVYPGFRDVLPEEVRDAYLAGLRRHVRRLLDRGMKELPGRTQGMATWAAPALWMASKALGDPAISREAEAYVRPIFTEERFFHPAGYFAQGGSLDSFNGISTWFAVWGALVGDWPFAREAVARVYRLRTHLILPEPDGALVGPSHMAALTSADPAHEQWDWPMRSWAAAMITDEAVCLTKMPEEAAIRNATAATVAGIRFQLQELSWAPGGLDPSPWKFQAAGTLVNFAYQYYPKGFYAHRIALEEKQDPLVRLPVLREGRFIRTFGNEFVVAKTPTHAVIVNTGPITDRSDPGSGWGLGGGALSAFWTPAAGSVILGRGIGAWSPMYGKMLDQWRSLPTHAVTGITAEGKVFTSAQIARPEATAQSTDKDFTVTARGLIPQSRQGGEKLLSGAIEYARTFESTAGGVRITTTLTGDGQDSIAELYEVLPVFLREAGLQPKATPTTIEFQAQGQWAAATAAFQENVTAIRLKRFDGAVAVTFDRPRRVRLSPEDWQDTYMSHASCRNILIDLMDGTARPAAVKAASVRYTIAVDAGQ